MQRRQFIAAAGSVAAVGLAGCIGGDDDNGDNGGNGGIDTSSADAALESYLTGVEDEDDFEAVVHSESPLEYREGEEANGEEGEQEIDEQTYEIIEEDLDEDDLDDYIIQGIEDEEIETIAEGDVAIVEYTVEMDGGSATEPVDWLVATEDDEWQVVEVATEQ